MKQLRWWAPIAAALLTLAFGIVPFVLLSWSGKIPYALRDNPWPMEFVAVLAFVAVIGVTVLAFRQKRLRVLSTLCALVSGLSVVAFLFLVHVATFELPTPPKELAVGTAAPDFTLPNEAGQPVALASLRNHPTVLVFYRGAW